MNKQQITELINSEIIDNDNGQITAEVMRYVLNAINEGVGDGYTYIGTATPSTTPMNITAENKVFYIATEEGDYANFGQKGIKELTIFKSDNGRWVKEGLGISLDIDGKLAKLKYQHYVYCRTSADISKKEVTINGTSDIDLKNIRIAVYFMKNNTADNVTLSVNGIEKPLYYNTDYASSINSWIAGETLDVVYNAYTDTFLAFTRTSLVQETGDRKTGVMSQYAVTRELNNLSDKISDASDLLSNDIGVVSNFTKGILDYSEALVDCLSEVSSLGYYIDANLLWQYGYNTNMGGGFISKGTYKTISVTAQAEQMALIAFIAEMPSANNELVVFSKEYDAIVYIQAGETFEVDIPSDCEYVYIQMISAGVNWLPQAITVKEVGSSRLNALEDKVPDLEEKDEELEHRVGLIEENLDISYAIKWDVPENQGVANVIQKAYDLVNVSVTLRNSLSANGVNYAAGDVIKGLPYSSTRVSNTMVPSMVSLETYISAISSPRSYAYTISPGLGSHANLYYGIVCIVFAQYCLGIKDNMHINWELFSVNGFEVVPEQSAQAVKLGDVINIGKDGQAHCRVVVGIARQGREVVRIKLGESVGPVCRIYETSASNFDSMLQTYTLIRYNKLQENTYNPEYSPFRFYDINRHLMPKKGNKSNWGIDEDVVVDVLNADDYTHYEICKNGIVTATEEINGATTINLGRLPYGKYTMRLKNGSNSSNAVEWIVIDYTFSAQALEGGYVKMFFSSKNSTPVTAHWAREDMMNLVSFKISETDILNGYLMTELSKKEMIIKGIEGYDKYTKYDHLYNFFVTEKNQFYPRLCFQTEFGVWTVESEAIEYVE